MDAAEIARLRVEWRNNPEVLELVEALEQARKELAGAKEDIQGWHELWGEYDRTGSELADMLTQRDAAQQSAEAARALAYEECAKMIEGWGHECGRSIAAALRARIEAFLEPKI